MTQRIRLVEKWANRDLWSPYDLTRSVLKAWFDADDLAAASVSTWTDRIGLLATTAATTAIPTWSATGWTTSGTSLGAAKAGVTFDGVANCMASTTLTTLPTGAVAGEIWALVSQDTGAGTAGTMNVCRYGGTGATVTRSVERVQSSGANRFRVEDGATNLTDTSATFFGKTIIGGYWSGTTEGGRINGADTSPATATISTLNTGTARIRLGASNANTASQFFTGVARHVIITTALTSSQRLQMEGWLAWDGGVQSLLPASHPYKNSPP